MNHYCVICGERLVTTVNHDVVCSFWDENWHMEREADMCKNTVKGLFRLELVSVINSDGMDVLIIKLKERV